MSLAKPIGELLQKQSLPESQHMMSFDGTEMSPGRKGENSAWAQNASLRNLIFLLSNIQEVLTKNAILVLSNILLVSIDFLSYKQRWLKWSFIGKLKT